MEEEAGIVEWFWDFLLWIFCHGDFVLITCKNYIYSIHIISQLRVIPRLAAIRRLLSSASFPFSPEVLLPLPQYWSAFAGNLSSPPRMDHLLQFLPLLSSSQADNFCLRGRSAPSSSVSGFQHTKLTKRPWIWGFPQLTAMNESENLDKPSRWWSLHFLWYLTTSFSCPLLVSQDESRCCHWRQ